MRYLIVHCMRFVITFIMNSAPPCRQVTEYVEQVTHEGTSFSGGLIARPVISIGLFATIYLRR